MSQLEQITEYIKKSYGDSPEFLWEDFDSAIWRNQRNKKWYTIVQNPTRGQLGVVDDDSDVNELSIVNDRRLENKITILNVRLDPLMVVDLIDNKRYFPGYHMNKKYWLTICLNDTIPLSEIYQLIDKSYQIIDSKK